MRTRVAIVDDNAVVRMGLRSLLLTHPDLEVVGEAADGPSAVELVAECRPDVTLMDVRMPGGDGVAATAELGGQTRVVMLTYNDSPQVVRAALEAGALGYLVHGQFDAQRLGDMVRSAAAGVSTFSAGLIESLHTSVPSVPDRGSFGLSGREQEVMDLISQGCSNRDLARRLFLSEKTVKNHINRIFAKLGVSSRAQATTLWLTGQVDRGNEADARTP